MRSKRLIFAVVISVVILMFNIVWTFLVPVFQRSQTRQAEIALIPIYPNLEYVSQNHTGLLDSTPSTIITYRLHESTILTNIEKFYIAELPKIGWAAIPDRTLTWPGHKEIYFSKADNTLVLNFISATSGSSPAVSFRIY